MKKNHFQTIANMYTTWYARQPEISQNINSTYFFCDPQEVHFKLPSDAPKNQLDAFLNDAWLPGSTCDSAIAQDPLEQFLPNPCEHHWHSYKINECHHLDTILLPPIESYHASTPIQQVLAIEQPKLL